MRKIGWVTVILLCSCFVTTGCNTSGISNPQYWVDTYDELKEELKECEEILYPDISRYEEEGFNYVVNHKPANENDKQGYLIFWDILANEDGPLSETSLRDFNVYCTTLEYIAYDTDKTKGFWHERAELHPNMELEGVSIEHNYNESYVNLNEEDIEKISELTRYPNGTYENWNGYKFEYKGCEYTVNGTIRLLPEEQLVKEVELEVEKGREELLDVIRSILAQGDEKE